MTTGAPWTADDDERLRAGWPTESLSVIGEALGRTRSSVISRAGRIGLPSKKPPRVKLVRPTPPVVLRRQALLRRTAPGLPVRPVAAEAPAGSAPRNKSLLDLAVWDCHWPIGDPRDPDFAFCAAPALRQYGYCAHHERMNYGK
jgi:GcrA cell cycle regulator